MNDATIFPAAIGCLSALAAIGFLSKTDYCARSMASMVEDAGDLRWMYVPSFIKPERTVMYYVVLFRFIGMFSTIVSLLSLFSLVRRHA